MRWSVGSTLRLRRLGASVEELLDDPRKERENERPREPPLDGPRLFFGPSPSRATLKANETRLCDCEALDYKQFRGNGTVDFVGA
jgi:hypothetical protein